MMSIYETVTNRILKQLEAGQIPWRQTWTIGLPKSLTTRKEYRGINILILGTLGFSSRYWVTYRQALALGGNVRKGEKATTVVYWKWRTKEELQDMAIKTGKENLAPCVPFTSSVFNIDQVEGIARPEDDVPQQPQNRLKTGDQLLEVMPDKPRINHGAGSAPAYHPVTDCVMLPGLSQFESVDHYYATLFHELVHATGHPRRLNRFAEGERASMADYSFEELVAEFGSAFLCAFAGISNPANEALQASYIDGWSTVLRKDSRMILRAASAAQRAADFIRGKLKPEEVSVAAESENVSLSA